MIFLVLRITICIQEYIKRFFIIALIDSSYTFMDIPPDHTRFPNLENVEKC